MVRVPGAADAPQPHSFWIPVICGAAILTIGIGARQSFGIFQKPIAADLSSTSPGRSFGAGSAADILEGHAGAALRALAFVMFLALPLSWLLVLVFAASLGFLWLGTVPLTSGLVGYMFGPTHLSMLWGIVFFSHQLGSFLGGWGAGRIYDLRGDYGLIWWISVGLGIFAALLHWRIRERPVPRLAIAEGTA